LAGGDHDLLDEISGDSGGGSVAGPHHALVHLHQVLLLHSKTALLPKSLPASLSPSLRCLHALPSSPSCPAPSPSAPLLGAAIASFRAGGGWCEGRGGARVFSGFWSGRPVPFLCFRFCFGVDRLLKTLGGEGEGAVPHLKSSLPFSFEFFLYVNFSKARDFLPCDFYHTS
jgi:hypothetical protein